MKVTRRLFILSIVFVAMMAASCSKHSTVVILPKNSPKSANAKSVPPGQAKKATGSQSAKQFAPGQQKKK